LAKLTRLQRLDLENNETIADAGISGLSNLTFLSLNVASRITDRGIRDLTYLSDLHLIANYLITDFGISRLPNLKHLKCRNSHITGAGITGLTNLVSINTPEKVLRSFGRFGY
jgi:hypothetical protein